jgi:hypothetical protein
MPKYINDRESYGFCSRIRCANCIINKSRGQIGYKCQKAYISHLSETLCRNCLVKFECLEPCEFMLNKQRG